MNDVILTLTEKDLKTGQRILDKETLNETEVPQEGEIKERMVQQARRQDQIDIDAAVYVYFLLLKAMDEDNLDDIVTKAYHARDKRKYTARTPFSVLLIDRFGYKPSKAGKIGIYLRSAWRKEWTVSKLHHQMKTNWKVERSAAEARAFLKASGEIKERKKYKPKLVDFGGGLLNETTAASSGPKGDKRSDGGHHAPENSELGDVDIREGRSKDSIATVVVPRPSKSKIYPGNRLVGVFEIKADGAIHHRNWCSQGEVNIAEISRLRRSKPGRQMSAAAKRRFDRIIADGRTLARAET